MKVIYPSPLKALLLACLIVQLIVSCKKSDAVVDSVDQTTSTSVLKFTQQTLSILPYVSASADVVIESNVDWQVSASQNDWLQLSKTSGKGSDTIHITVIKENLTTQARTITLKVVSVDASMGLQSQLTIDQKAINVQMVSERAYGGSNIDKIYSLVKTTDGGLLIAGLTGSQRDGDVGGSLHGSNYDFWVARLNSNGDTVWTRSIGGAGYEWLTAATATTDGGFAVAGCTASSQSGDVRGVNKGVQDWFIVKLKSNGDTLWTRMVGGAKQDIPFGITGTADGGIVVVGQLNWNTSEGDAMVVKYNSNGDLAWQKVFGGIEQDNATSVAVTANGSILVAGWTMTNNSGDIGTNHGNGDMWVLKLTSNGDKIWSKLYGGSGYDIANAIALTADDGFIIAGNSSSLDQDIVGKNHAQTQTKGDGYADMWVVKCNAGGDILWSNALGGPYGDECLGVAVTPDGGCIAVGDASTVGRDIEKIHDNPDPQYGASDYWVVRLSNTGNKLWSKTYGCSEADIANSVVVNADNSIIVGGYLSPRYSTSSVVNGDVKSNRGVDDGWLIKLRD
jgi:hypothetical protein